MTGDRKTSAAVNTPVEENHGQISPNGKWLAYHGAVGTARPDVFVQPFAGGAGRYQVSTAGGTGPRWRGDGRELFFLEPTRFSPLPYGVTNDGQRFLISRPASNNTDDAEVAAIAVVLNWAQGLKK